MSAALLVWPASHHSGLSESMNGYNAPWAVIVLGVGVVAALLGEVIVLAEMMVGFGLGSVVGHKHRRAAGVPEAARARCVHDRGLELSRSGSFEAIGIGGIAWYGLALVAMFAGSLFDRERFYGPSGPSSPQAPRT